MYAVKAFQLLLKFQNIMGQIGIGHELFNCKSSMSFPMISGVRLAMDFQQYPITLMKLCVCYYRNL